RSGARNPKPRLPVHSRVTHNTEVKRKMLTRVGVPVELEAEPSAPGPQPTTLICFSHLRWNFVFQRPQHLMSRFAREMNVIYWEEPIEIGPRETAYLQVREAQDAANVRIVVPHLPQGMPQDAREAALSRLLDPPDQEDLPRPRFGYYGVIDERFDTALLDQVAKMRPDWSFVIVGPVVKISEDELPRRHNIHYLGSKTYDQLPAYLSGWDVALM